MRARASVVVAMALIALGCDGSLSGGGGSRGEDASVRRDAQAPAASDGAVERDAQEEEAPDGGACAGVSCGANARCEEASGDCVCLPGFLDQGAGCIAIPPGDPAGRTAEEVCAQWTAGHVERASDPWNEVPGDMCAPGTLTAEALEDTVRRVNLFRWMVGLGPVTDDPAQHPRDQACALMMERNNRLDHAPPMSWTCWSMAGRDGAGSANLALGVRTPGDAIDLYMSDRGVESLGHRRWVLNGPLGKVGIGFAGRAQCLGVFDRSGTYERRWTSWPSPGSFPEEALELQDWSFHSNEIALGSATVRVIRVSDGAELPVTVMHPPDGYGPNTVSWRPMGWSAAVGERYRVVVEGISGGAIQFETAPTGC